MLEPNEMLEHLAGEPTWRGLDLPRTDEEALEKLVRSAKTPKQRSSLAQHMMTEYGDDGDRPENWSNLQRPG